LPGFPSHFFRDWHKIWCCSFVGSIVKSLQARCTTPNKRIWNISTSTQLREVSYTDSQDMLLLSSTVVSRYNNCCTGDGTNPEKYGYPIIFA
jgi:hypothetical protein